MKKINLIALMLLSVGYVSAQNHVHVYLVLQLFPFKKEIRVLEGFIISQRYNTRII
jgi:hypothetical protein